jgi:hypothetical protein
MWCSYGSCAESGDWVYDERFGNVCIRLCWEHRQRLAKFLDGDMIVAPASAEEILLEEEVAQVGPFRLTRAPFFRYTIDNCPLHRLVDGLDPHFRYCRCCGTAERKEAWEKVA